MIGVGAGPSMHSKLRAFDTYGPNQDLLHSAFFIEQICLLTAIQIVLINLLSRVLTPLDHLLPAGLLHMRMLSGLAGLSATVALLLSEGNRSKRLQRVGQILGMGTAVIAGVTLWSGISHDANPVRGQLLPGPGGSLAVPIAFLLLGMGIVLIRAREPLWSAIADTVASCLAFLELVLLSEFLFGLARIPGSSIVGPIKAPTLACLALLTLVVVLRRAKHGIFSVFLSDGIDGRVARIVAPILLALPFLRELGRARLLDAHLVPTRYATAVLTSTATLIGFVLLLVLSRLIKRMQYEIQQVNLRDELTGLYNFRGFNLFAEQAYRLARRSGQPFGVLFADMDNLKVINDQFGHNAGSICIVEAAKVLGTTFRDTDVIGRLGGDEFVVAGQFDGHQIAGAMERLRSALEARKEIAGKKIALSLSLGYASTEHDSKDTLKALVARADKMMYIEKRQKKRTAG